MATCRAFARHGNVVLEHDSWSMIRKRKRIGDHAQSEASSRAAFSVKNLQDEAAAP